MANRSDDELTVSSGCRSWCEIADRDGKLVLPLPPLRLQSFPCHPKEVSMSRASRRITTQLLRDNPAAVLEIVIARQEPAELFVAGYFCERNDGVPVAVIVPAARYAKLIGVEETIKQLAASSG